MNIKHIFETLNNFKSKGFNYNVVHFIDNNDFGIDYVNIKTSRATIWDSKQFQIKTSQLQSCESHQVLQSG